jgi:hypothetical protein
MALTGEKLIDEVQALTGREGDTELVTDARCTRWLNEAQHDIVEEIAGMFSQTFRNRDSFDTTAVLRYSIADITVGEITTSDKVARVWYVGYLDGAQSKKLKYLHVDEFDEAWPDPTHSDIPTTISEYWTRRGGNIEIMPICATGDHNKDLRFDGDWYAGDFTTNDVTASDLSHCDEGMINFAVSKAWGAIGNETKRVLWKQKYEDWLRERKDKEDLIHAWDGNME